MDNKELLYTDNKELFKTLIEILFLLLLLGVGVIMLILPFMAGAAVDGLKGFSVFGGIAAVIAIACVFLFLRGLFYLRKVAKHLLANQYFSIPIVNSLRKSGKDFLWTGLLSLGVMGVLWIGNVTEGELVFGLDINMMASLFLMIVGLFFIIQSNALAFAKDIKAENDLTV